MPLSWIALVIAGSALGWLASVFLHAEGAGAVVGLVLAGVAGALLGAILLSPMLAGKLEPTGFSLPGVLLSLLGAFLALGLAGAALHLQRRRRPR